MFKFMFRVFGFIICFWLLIFLMTIGTMLMTDVMLFMY